MGAQLVNRVPPGLLSLLGIKSTGLNPALLSDTISPVLDLLATYVQANGTYQRCQTAAINATGLWAATATPGTGVVPAGSIWAVSNLTIAGNATLAAGTSYLNVSAAYYTSPSVDLTQTFGLPTPFASASAVGSRVFTSFNGVIVLPPNATLAVHVADGTFGTPVAMNVNFRYIELTI